MKNLYKYASAAVLGLLMISILSSSVMAVSPGYVPTDEDLSEYELVYSDEVTSTNPFGSGDISMGMQLWVDDTENIQVVIGSVVISADNNPLLENIPALVKSTLQAIFPELNLNNVNTYWDLFVKLVVTYAPEVFTDITAEVATTDSSLAIAIGTSFYGVISIDAQHIFWAFGLIIDSYWLTYLDAQIIAALEGYLGQFASAIGAYSGYLGGSGLCGAAIPLPDASDAPTTSSEDVNEFVSDYGTFYTSGIPGYSALIILGLIGAFVLYFAKRKVVLH